MACQFPYMVDNPKPMGNDAYRKIPVPCGKCYDCKMRTVSQWALRLRKEEEKSSSSFFVTLTYDTDHVPITKKGFMSLEKSDVQKFIKRLRKLENEKVTYFAVGEYGSKKFRPHYHVILFNATESNIRLAWMLNRVDLGGVHIGNVSGKSIAYTLKYMIKESKIPVHANDDRVKEFRLMSKGLGINYLTPEMVKWHKADYSRLYTVIEDGIKVALPRYFREKIWTEEERQKQNQIVQTKLKNDYDKSEKKYRRESGGKDYRKHKLESAEYKTQKAFKKSNDRSDL